MPLPSYSLDYDADPITGEVDISAQDYDPPVVSYKTEILTSSLTEDALVLAYIQQWPPGSVPENYVDLLATPGSPYYDKFQKELFDLEGAQEALAEGAWSEAEMQQSSFVSSNMWKAHSMSKGVVSSKAQLRVYLGLDEIEKQPFISDEPVVEEGSDEEGLVSPFTIALALGTVSDQLISDPAIRYLAEIYDELEAEYQAQNQYSTPEEFLNNVVLPTAEARYANTLPIGSPSSFQDVLDPAMAELWNSEVFDERFSQHIRDSILNHARRIQLNNPWLDTRRKVLDALTEEGILRAANEGILDAIGELHNGPKMKQWLTDHPESNYYSFLQENPGITVRDFAAALGQEFPSFEAERTSGEPVPGITLPQTITDLMVLLPRRIKDLVGSEMANALQTDSPEAFQERIASIDNLGVFVSQSLRSALVRTYGAGIAEHIDDVWAGSSFAFVASLKLPHDTFYDEQVVAAMEKVISTTEDDVSEVVRTHFADIIDTFATPLTTQLLPAVEAELEAIAELQGVSVSDLLATGAGEDVLERALKGLLGESYEELDLIAQINGSTVTDVLRAVEGNDLTLAEIVEQAQATEVADEKVGESDETQAARRALEDIQTSRAADEVAEDVAQAQDEFTAENPRVAAQQEELRQQAILDQQTTEFLRRPAVERVEAEVGRNFVGRNRDRVARELSQTVQDDLVKFYEEQVSQIESVNGPQTPDSLPNKEEFFQENIGSFVPDRKKQLGTLRELQAQDRFTTPGIARTTQRRTRGGR